VQDLGDERVGVGDVAGRRISAAAVMGRASAAVHTAGQAGLDPARVLTLIDAQLYEVTGPGRPDNRTPAAVRHG
jgi:hypothetical protein